MADEEHQQWELEAAATRRFRTPRTHALLHAALQLALEQERSGAVARELYAADLEAMRVLAAREAELESAARAANAALAADDYDDAV